MSARPWTSTDDVLMRWIGPGAPAVNDAALANTTEDAENIIVETFPRIADRIESGDVRLSTIRRTVAAMVMRVFRNPENLTQFQQSVGPASQGKSYREAVGLDLTDQERQRLAPRNQGKAYSVDLMPNPTVRRGKESSWS